MSRRVRDVLVKTFTKSGRKILPKSQDIRQSGKPTMSGMEDPANETDADYDSDGWLARWAEHESALGELATDAMAAFLSEGKILGRNITIENFLVERGVDGEKLEAGSDPSFHGLVTGKWKESEVIVFVVARVRLLTPRDFASAVEEVTYCTDYWKILLKLQSSQEGFDEIREDYYRSKYFRDMKVKENRGRKVMIAVASDNFAEGSTGKFREPQEWFRIQRTSYAKYTVTPEFAT